jgi:hypothetical protein
MFIRRVAQHARRFAQTNVRKYSAEAHAEDALPPRRYNAPQTGFDPERLIPVAVTAVFLAYALIGNGEDSEKMKDEKYAIYGHGGEEKRHK